MPSISAASCGGIVEQRTDDERVSSERHRFGKLFGQLLFRGRRDYQRVSPIGRVLARRACIAWQGCADSPLPRGPAQHRPRQGRGVPPGPTAPRWFARAESSSARRCLRRGEQQDKYLCMLKYINKRFADRRQSLRRIAILWVRPTAWGRGDRVRHSSCAPYPLPCPNLGCQHRTTTIRPVGGNHELPELFDAASGCSPVL
jgi:hypothetical protein